MLKMIAKIFGAMMLLLFFVLIGGVFVLMSIMLGKPELILMVVVLMTACLIQSYGKQKMLKIAHDLPLVGDATDMLGFLHKHYQNVPPKSTLYYVFYPITSVFNFLFSRKIRSELGRYFKLIHWIVLICIVEGLYTIYSLYQSFGLGFAIKWTLLEMVLIYFLCNLFSIPMLICSIRLLLAKSYRSLFSLIICTIICLGGFFYYFTIENSYSGLIFKDIILEKRIKPESQEPKSLFISQLEDATQMFCEHHLPKLGKIFAEKQDAWDTETQMELGTEVQKLNEAYQNVLLSISPYQENTLFYITTNADPKDLWGFVCVPMRESIFLAFQYKNHNLNLYDKWSDMLDDGNFQQKWNQEGYHAFWAKQLARVVLEESRKSVPAMEKSLSFNKDQENSMFESDSSVRRPFAMSNEAPSKSNSNQIRMLKIENKGNREITVDERKKLKEEWDSVRNKFMEWDSKKPDDSVLKTSMTNLLTYIQNFRNSNTKTKIIPNPNINDLFKDIKKNWNSEWPIQLPASLENDIQLFIQQQMKFQADYDKCKKLKDEYMNIFNRVEQDTSIDTGKLKEKISAFNKASEEVKASLPHFTDMEKKINETASIFHSYARSCFIIYDKNISSFNFQKASEFKFICDHFGKGPSARSENTMTMIFGAILNFLLIAFMLFMPIHVVLIIHSYWWCINRTTGEAANKKHRQVSVTRKNGASANVRNPKI